MKNLKTVISLSLCWLAGHPLLAQCKFEVALSGKDVRCYGEFNGEATVTVNPVSAATGPYEIQWFDGSAAGFRNDLPAGTHFVKVTDALGCFVNEFITINEPALLTGTLAVQHVRCHGEPQGSIDLTLAGGTAPYYYQWSNGESTEDINTLVAGAYTLHTEDKKGCTFDDGATVAQPQPIEVSPSVIPVSCYGGSDGEIKATVFGGVQAYRYAWSTGDTIPDIYGLPAGVHTLTITDDNLCVKTEPVYMPQPQPITVHFTVKKVSCFDLPDGEVFAQVNGGTPGYQYKWSNAAFVLGDTTNYPKNLYSDYYTLEVTDTKGCRHEDSVLVIEPNPLVINLEETDATCFNKPDGQIDLSVSGGTLPYSVLWSNGSRGEDINGLLSGDYQVDVVDSLGCTRYGQIFVGQPDSLDFRYIIEEVTCKDQVDGIISINPTGGTPGYQARWSNGKTDFYIADLPGGLYTVELTDTQNCLYIGEFAVSINPQDCITRLNIPNTFTPNGDDYNDLWVIHNYEVYPDMKVHVIDKWGKTVFDSSGYLQPWDGTRNSADVQAGTYYYTVDLMNGDPPFTGTVTIIR